MSIKAGCIIGLVALLIPAKAIGGYVPLVRLVVSPQDYVNSEVRTVGVAQAIEGDFGVFSIYLFFSREQAELGVDGIECSVVTNRKSEELKKFDGLWVMVEGRFVGPEKRIADTLSYGIINVEAVEVFQPLRKRKTDMESN